METHTYACLQCGFRLRMIVETGAELLAGHCLGAPWVLVNTSDLEESA